MPLTYGISYTYIGILIHVLILITDIYLYSVIPMYSHIIHVFLFLYESNLLRNWNYSNQIIQTQVMAFSCQLVGLPILPDGQFAIFIFQCLFSIFETCSLYLFKSKVLRFLLQLESPKSEHQNSRYVQNNQDCSMIQN